MLAAGGTTLTLNPDNSYNSETGWSKGSDSFNTTLANASTLASGGGVSVYEPEPPSQDGVQTTGYRTIPDVAFDADPNSGVIVYDSYDTPSNSNHWTLGSGTSLGAPCWAGLIAIVNAARSVPLDGRSQTLPALYSLPPGDFNDNLGGNNFTDNSGILNPAIYNEVTGLGSPKANLLVPALVNWQVVSLGTGSIQDGSIGVAYHQTITASGGTGDKTITFAITGNTKPADLGLAFTASTNQLTITGTPRAAGIITFSMTATDLLGGTAMQSYTLTINPENVTGQVSLSESGLVYSRATQLFGGTITLTNTGTTAIGSTVEVVLTGLPSGVTLANASGYTADGNPYILVALPDDTLAAGQSINFTVLFSNPKKLSFQYGTSIFDE